MVLISHTEYVTVSRHRKLILVHPVRTGCVRISFLQQCAAPSLEHHMNRKAFSFSIRLFRAFDTQSTGSFDNYGEHEAQPAVFEGPNCQAWRQKRTFGAVLLLVGLSAWSDHAGFLRTGFICDQVSQERWGTMERKHVQCRQTEGLSSYL